MRSEEVDGLLPILTVSSDSRRAALAAWESSLDGIRYPRSLRLVVHLGELDPPPGHCTASWALAHERELQEVLGYLEAHRDQRVIVSDVGVQFFPVFKEVQKEWVQLMDADGLDMLFLRERGQAFAELRQGEVSARFLIIHSTDASVRFWRQVLEDQLAERRMASYLPYTPQYHVNNLLTYFPGGGPQDGAHGISWNYIPDKDVLIAEPDAGQDLRCIAVFAPLEHQEDELSRCFVYDAVYSQQGRQRLDLGAEGGLVAAHEALLRRKAIGESEATVGRIAAEVRRLRQEFESNPRGRLERQRPALALAAAELLVEVEKLAGAAASTSNAAFQAVD